MVCQLLLLKMEVLLIFIGYGFCLVVMYGFEKVPLEISVPD